MNRSVLPGSTIGIIGGGQLGKMMAHAAQRMGYSVSILDPDPDAPACRITDRRIIGRYDDARHIALLRQSCDVITYEFENVNPEPLYALLKEGYPLHPDPEALYIARNRSREKRFAESCGFSCVPWIGGLMLDPSSSQQMQKIIEAAITFKDCILKTEEGGYDGRGQLNLGDLSEEELHRRLTEFHRSLGASSAVPVILERRIQFRFEFSIIASRFTDGSFRIFPAFENSHRNGILHRTICPAELPSNLELQHCHGSMRRMLSELNYFGVLTVEFFLSEDGQILFNEMAPRPHNSGHLTIEGCTVSQFEQHIRSICGLPPGEPSLYRPAGMVNLVAPYRPIAEIAPAILKEKDCHLHLYGKKQEKAGRKMGHITVLADTREELVARLDRLDEIISG
jgi:5-(carboxyamino)imidazole ribonucleotide synthase